MPQSIRVPIDAVYDAVTALSAIDPATVSPDIYARAQSAIDALYSRMYAQEARDAYQRMLAARRAGRDISDEAITYDVMRRLRDGTL